MSALANSVQKPERFDVYVRKFRSICMMHGVPVGSRKELPAFLRALMDDRHLAMDFWGFIGKLSDREGGALSDDQMISVIIEGVTECDISEQDGGAQRTIDDLRAMLAGVDIQGPGHSQVEIAPFPKSEAGAPQDDKQLDKKQGEEQLDGKRWARAEELATKPPNPQPLAPVPAVEEQLSRPVDKPFEKPVEKPFEKPFERQATSVSAAPAAERPGKQERRETSEESHRAPVAPPPQLDEALLRLELTRLVQQYFDNIDKRISKLEPPAEGAIAPPVTRRSLEEPISSEEIEELRLKRMGRARLVLEPAPQPVEVSAPPPAAAEDDDVPMRIPLEHYSPPPIYGRAPFLLLLLLVGAGFAIYHDPTLVRKGVSFVVRQFHNHTDRTAPPSTHSATPSSPAAPVPAATTPSQPSALQSVLEGTSTPSRASTSEEKTPPPPSQPAAVAQSAGNEFDSDSSRKTAADRLVAQTEQAIADGISSIESPGAVRVNPSVMDENLIVQRVPAYPESAKMSGVQGDVIMQALISKEGTVKRVHVTEGDSRLRIAAEEAVYKWRYRPYVLHGRPVEVATTVTVNFNLNR